MDATPASASENGFDAALKALEDLETSVVQTREDSAKLAPAAAPVVAIDFSDDGEEPLATAIAVAAPAAPIAEDDAEADAAPAEEGPTAAQGRSSAIAGSGKWTRIAIGLGLFSSVVSAAGLIVAERTIVSAQLVVADARERAHQLEQANKLIRDLELVRDKQIELLQAQNAQLASQPVTSAELTHRMDVLQQSLATRDPLNNIVQAIQAGQTDTNARFNEFGMKMDRVEAALGGR